MPARKLNVAVLIGGKSPEHEVSLSTGQQVIKNLNASKYNVFPIVISNDGKEWLLEPSIQQIEDAQDKKVSALSIMENPEGLLEANEIDVVFIAMHGPFGEDGTIQGFLELVGIPYTGSKVLASALGMDKSYSRKLFTQVGLKVPKGLTIGKSEFKRGLKTLKLPLFVKPNNQGSSVGTSIVELQDDLEKALDLAFQYSDLAIVDEYIKGTEITCAIIGNENPKALPLVEIVPKKSFFDYEAKYSPELTDEICPARISRSLTKKAQDAALAAYKALGCIGFGRVDMILKGNDVYVLEVNTIPGLTPVSLFPKAAKANGISYPQLLDKLIKLALQ